jgi:acylphosphatase
MVKTYRFVVTGRVQGVGFRYYTIHQAQLLGLVGTVRNRPDGRVEGTVQGNSELLQQFFILLKKGPALSRVESIIADPHPPIQSTEFLATS